MAQLPYLAYCENRSLKKCANTQTLQGSPCQPESCKSTYYVDILAPTGGDGLTPQTAYNDLALALIDFQNNIILVKGYGDAQIYTTTETEFVINECTTVKTYDATKAVVDKSVNILARSSLDNFTVSIQSRVYSALYCNNYCKVSNIIITDNDHENTHGIFLNNSTALNCTVYGCSYGFFLGYSDVAGCTATSCIEGFRFVTGNTNMVSCVAVNNEYGGFSAESYQSQGDVILTDCIAENNGCCGYRFEDSPNFNFTAINCQDNNNCLGVDGEPCLFCVFNECTTV